MNQGARLSLLKYHMMVVRRSSGKLDHAGMGLIYWKCYRGVFSLNLHVADSRLTRIAGAPFRSIVPSAFFCFVLEINVHFQGLLTRLVGDREVSYAQKHLNRHWNELFEDESLSRRR